MDKIDRKILRALHHDARITNLALADKVCLSTSPCSARVRRMEQEGVIQQYVTIFDRNSIGLPDTAIIEFMFERQDEESLKRFEDKISNMPEVIEAHLITGEYDCFMKVAVAGTKGYEEFLVNKLWKIEGIKNTRSSLTLRCFKQNYSPAPAPQDT
jgi:Lrp/AsnC family transcriptional regulator, leucine-responsive regulatory protein